MPDTTQKRKVATAQDVKNRQFYYIEVGDLGLFKMRRADLPTLLMEGIVPKPLLAAVVKLEKTRNWDGDPMTALAESTPEERGNMTEMMRRCAVAMTVQPQLTHDPAAAMANDDLLDVAILTTTDLMIIWKAVLGQAKIVEISPVEATTFHPLKSTAADHVLRDGEGVSQAPIGVDLHTGSLATPAPTEKPIVEFVGGR